MRSIQPPGRRAGLLVSSLTLLLLITLGTSTLLQHHQHHHHQRAVLGAAAAAPHGSVLDLDEASFSPTLAALPETHPCVVEFYASWCPACRLFASTYAEIGRVLGAAPWPPGGPQVAAGAAEGAGGRRREDAVLVARIDCAKDPQLCSSFRVAAYPSVTAGTAAAFASKSSARIKTYPMKGPRTTKDVVNWAAKALELQLDDAALAALLGARAPSLPAHQGSAGYAHPASNVWTLTDVESTTVFLFSSITSDPALHTGADKRQALLDMVKLWAAAHPSPRCRAPAQLLFAFFDKHWPESDPVAPKELLKYEICGPGAAKDKWKACSSSVPEARGFTCGLWLMFHTCAQRLQDDGERGTLLLSALRSFTQHFFLCQVCQQHFTKLLGTPQAAAVRTKRDAVLWMWQAHNEVNVRLMGIESKYGHSSSGDPHHPKRLFPSPEACPRCRATANASAPALEGAQSPAAEGQGELVAWDMEHVLGFLERTFAQEPVHEADSAWAWAQPLVWIVSILTLVVASTLCMLWCLASKTMRVVAVHGRCSSKPLSP